MNTVKNAKPVISRTRAILLAAGLVVVGVLVWFGVSGPARSQAETAPKSAAVAVDTALVTTVDVPQYLEGLGTVQAFNTVTINSRVDGQLQKVGFVEGQEVRKGDLLAQIDPRPNQDALELAQATLAKDQAQLDNAKRDLDRYNILAPQELASKQTLDTQKALVAQLQAQIKADQAGVSNAKTQLDYTSITSPIDGRTGIRLVDVGNNVHSTDSTGIVVVTQMQPISVIFTLPEEALPEVSLAMAKGTVGITALSRDDKTTLDQGTLALIDNQIDATTGTAKLKATFPNAHRLLWPGQFVNARLLLQMQHGVLTIPAAAAQRGPDGIFTYVVKADSTVEARPLQTGTETSSFMVVNSGLKAGERVVISNQYRLQPGTQVHDSSAGKAKPAAGGGSAP